MHKTREAIDEQQKAFYSKNEKIGDWFCPKCNVYIDSRNVTYEEYHDTCGTFCEWHTTE